MKKTFKFIVKMASVAVLAVVTPGLGLGGARLALAGESAESGGSAGAAARPKHGHMTATVSTIDKAGHSVVLTDDRGERTTVHVPTSMKSANDIKPGDRVAVTYQEPLAIGLVTPSETAGGAGAKGAATASCGASRETTANVVSADRSKGELTFRGPGGQIQTVRAADAIVEDKLGNLKPGDLVKVTYTEPVAASIAPVKD